MKYHFLTSQFGATDDEIHLIRKGFIYKTIQFSTINSVEVNNGFLLNNWIIIFAIGSALLISGLYMAIGTINTILEYGVRGGQIRIVLVLFIPVMGAYFVYESVQYGTIVKIKHDGNKVKRLSLKKFDQGKSLRDFDSFMRTRLENRFVSINAQ